MSLNIAADDWLTDQIRKPAYRLQVTDVPSEQDYKHLKDWINEKASAGFFVYSKVPVDNIRAVAWMERAGFNLVDTNVRFIKEISDVSQEKPDNNVSVRFSVPGDREPVVFLARNSFIYSRFHLDPEVANETADMIKGKWIENYYLGQRGDHMVVGRVGEEIAGFLLLLINSETLIIDLIGVDVKWRGQGVASAMIRFAEKNTLHKKFMVGTQIGNIPSVRLYEKLGFAYDGSDYVFHCHSQSISKA